MPIPTIVSNDRWSIVWPAAGPPRRTVSSPITSVSVLKPTRNESSPGIPIPPLTPSSVQMPPRYSVTSRWVCCTHSIAANLIGWSLAIARAAVSPTANWIGVRIAADRQRDQQAEAVVAVAAAAQHADRVDRGDQEAR